MDHVHTYKELDQVWDGHKQCRSGYCTTCLVGAASARIIPIGEGLPEGVTE